MASEFIPRTPAQRFAHRLRNVSSTVVANVAWLSLRVGSPGLRTSIGDLEKAADELRDLCERVEAAVSSFERWLTLPADEP